MSHWTILLTAYCLEAVFGYPRWLMARMSHPVVWIGTGIAVLEKNCNRPQLSERMRRALGIFTLIILLAATLTASLLLHLSPVAELLMTAALLATRSLYDHVRAVYLPLREGDTETARAAVSRIVGRDAASLDASGISRAAIESLAESLSDGVIAPLFWAACFGLPGLACYKAVNTADSMIGHNDERYLAFGWAAARLDDAMNYIPARLSALIIVLASCSPHAWRVMRRDAGKHASPNAGWPEAAMAGALGVQLGGPNYYDGIRHDALTLGEGAPATYTHLQQALQLYLIICLLLLAMLLAPAIVL